MVDDSKDYKGMIQNITWSKSQIDNKFNQIKLRTSDIASTNDTPTV